MGEAGEGRGVSDDLRALLHRWFVQFNPLYFFSAFCVLTGVHLVSAGMQGSGELSDRLWLMGILQAYEILLVIACAILFGLPKGRRPAVILAVLEMAFLLDPAMQLEALTTVSRGNPIVAAAWSGLAAVKISALTHALRLECDASATGVAAFRAGGLAVLLTALARPAAHAETALLAAAWFTAGLLAFEVWRKPRVRCTANLDDWGCTVLRRLTAAVPMGWTVVFLYHVWQSAHVYNVVISLAFFAPFPLAAAFAMRTESAVWTGSAAAVVMSLSHPEAAFPTALAAAVLMAWFAVAHGPRRMLTGAVLVTFLAGWLFGLDGRPFTVPSVWLVGQTIAVLAVLAWQYRLLSAGCVAGLMSAAMLVKPALLMGRLEAGAVLLVAGFASLVLGVMLTWKGGRAGGGDIGSGFARWEGGRSLFAHPMFLAVLLGSIVLAAVVPELMANAIASHRAPLPHGRLLSVR